MTVMQKGFFAAILLALVVAAVASQAGTISFGELLARARPSATVRVPTVNGQFGELFLPAGAGPHPVVVLIHGGCWLAELPGVELMDYIGEDLRGRGYAVWNIEYRRVGADGGGFPGTFDDIAGGMDALRELEPRYHLDLGHVIAVGHSAGGQLALWAAARGKLPKNSPLYRANPLAVAGVVSLAGIDDLAAYRARGGQVCGGPGVIDALTGAGKRSGDVFADTSPAELLPIGVKQVTVSGDLDPIVPPAFAHDYAAKAETAGDDVTDIEIKQAGHFELIDPQSAAWKQIVAQIDALAKR